MKHWEEFRTAYVVCQLGTISKAAEALGVHRASVIRHISVLEDHLQVSLFRRHARGYSMTDAGRDLLHTGQRVNGLFDALLLNATTQAIMEGPLKVSSIGLWSGVIARAAGRYKDVSPSASVELSVSKELSKLEVLEADIALRGGSKPDHPDYVVLPFASLRIGLFAHTLYLDRHGVPRGPQDYAQHRFIGAPAGCEDSPYWTWLRRQIPDSALCFACADESATSNALFDGVGIGFYPAEFAAQQQELQEVSTGGQHWLATFWVVTHGDLHHSTKVQRFLDCLREEGYLRQRSPVVTSPVESQVPGGLASLKTNSEE